MCIRDRDRRAIRDGLATDFNRWFIDFRTCGTCRELRRAIGRLDLALSRVLVDFARNSTADVFLKGSIARTRRRDEFVEDVAKRFFVSKRLRPNSLSCLVIRGDD